MRIDMYTAAETKLFRAIAEPHRRRILQALRDPGVCCGMRGRGLCERSIRELLLISQPTVSHHLKVLRDAGLIGAEKRGRWIWYHRIESKIRQLAQLVKK